MDYYLLQDHWSSLVRTMKDAERVFGIDAYRTDTLTREILRYATHTRIRQYNLFVQKRGEDFEKLRTKLVGMGFDEGSIDRTFENEEFWKVTLELSEA
jgi:hypothetical protein